jgi:uncharacterized protein (TIGR01777 family)
MLFWKERSAFAVVLGIMKIVISGSSGLIGSALLPSLEAAGHDVIRLVRRSIEGSSTEAAWNPAAGEIDSSAIDGADAVINLNGRSIAEGRWSAAVKEDLRTSRLESTRTLVDAIGRSDNPPGVLINASAVGFYGDRGDELLEESSPAGTGFLADLSRDWEETALAAASERTRAVLLRLGMVVAREGALKRMLTPFKLGLGGPIGSGRQFWPWIGIDDVCGIVNLVLAEDIHGPVNVVAPQELRCKEFSRTLGRALSRPAIIPAPAFAVRLALGEMADSLLLASQRVRPKALEEAGYAFRAPTLEDALRTALA